MWRETMIKNVGFRISAQTTAVCCKICVLSSGHTRAAGWLVDWKHLKLKIFPSSERKTENLQNTIWSASSLILLSFLFNWWWTTNQSDFLYQKRDAWNLHLDGRHQMYVIFVCMQLTNILNKYHMVLSHVERKLCCIKTCICYFGNTSACKYFNFSDIIELFLKCPIEMSQKREGDN